MSSKSIVRTVLFVLVGLSVLSIPVVPADATHVEPADELLFYRDSDGLFRFYDVGADGRIGRPILSGSDYTNGWTSIVAVDLDGDSQDELFFYRGSDGLYRYYDITPDGTLGSPLRSGSEYTRSWSSVVAPDLDGDGDDELLFYRGSDGLFRVYEVGADGRIGRPILSGSNYTRGWTSIVDVDLDGDGGDELLFSRSSDGLFRFYDVGADGRVGSPILSGTNYTRGWTSIVDVDLDGDSQDELLFYRVSDGLFRFYDVGADGRVGSPTLSGSNYTRGWSSVTAVDLDEVVCESPFTPARVSSLEARYPDQSFTAFVYDTRSGCSFAMNPEKRLRTASVFKVMVMAGTLFEAQSEGRDLTSWERSRLEPMIAESANVPVRDLWRSFGGSPWFTRQTEIFGLDHTNAVGDNERVWGRTTTSAEDQVDLLRQVLLGDGGPLREEYREEAWDLMTSVVPSQTWGITAGVPDGWTVAQKNGFAGHISNSVGFVQEPGSDEGYVIAILSNGWPNWERGVPIVEEIARWVSSGLAH